MRLFFIFFISINVYCQENLNEFKLKDLIVGIDSIKSNGIPFIIEDTTFKIKRYEFHFSRIKNFDEINVLIIEPRESNNDYDLIVNEFDGFVIEKDSIMLFYKKSYLFDSIERNYKRIVSIVRYNTMNKKFQNAFHFRDGFFIGLSNFKYLEDKVEEEFSLSFTSLIHLKDINISELLSYEHCQANSWLEEKICRILTQKYFRYDDELNLIEFHLRR